MRLYPLTRVQVEYDDLRAAGFKGTINDMQFAYLRSIGGTGSLADLMWQWNNGDKIAPILSGQVYNSGTDILTVNSTEGGTFYGHWTTSPSLSNALIQSGATTIIACAQGIGYYTVADVALAPGTWYLQYGVLDAASNFGAGVPVSQVIVAPSFVETWSSYVNGNGWTQLDVAYARSSSLISTTIQTDASGPAGLALRIGAASNNDYRINRDDITASLATRSTATRVQVLAKCRAVVVGVNQKAAIGYFDGANNWGIRVARLGVNNNPVFLQSGGDVNGGTNETSLGTLNDSALFWIRIEVNGLDIKGKLWLDGAGEPGAWTTRTLAANVAFPRLDLMVRATCCLSLDFLLPPTMRGDKRCY